jgi:hypothetical protein
MSFSSSKATLQELAYFLTPALKHVNKKNYAAIFHMNVLLEMLNITARFIDATVFQQKRASVGTQATRRVDGKCCFAA